MKKMNAILILAVLMLGAVCPRVAYCRPLTEEAEEDMDNGIESEPSQKVIEDFVKMTKTPPQKIVQKLGESIEIECEIMGSPAPNVEWFEGRHRIEEEFFENQISEGSPSAMVRAKIVLRIDKIIETERTFTCMGYVGGKKVHASTTIYPPNGGNGLSDVYEAQLRHDRSASKPKIIYSHPLHIDVVGSSIQLPCRVTGFPRPQVLWVNTDGYIRDENPRYKVLPNGDLLISDIKWEDMGAYKCIAKNSHGKDSADAFIYPALKE